LGLPLTSKTACRQIFSVSLSLSGAALHIADI
jgi:hypothetical protein